MPQFAFSPNTPSQQIDCFYLLPALKKKKKFTYSEIPSCLSSGPSTIPALSHVKAIIPSASVSDASASFCPRLQVLLPWSGLSHPLDVKPSLTLFSLATPPLFSTKTLATVWKDMFLCEFTCLTPSFSNPMRIETWGFCYSLLIQDLA